MPENMPDDPTVRWVQATRFGIQIDEHAEAWHSGHVNDIVELQDRSAIVVATESGGVWMIDANSNALQLSDTWDNPDVKCLALGPDGPRHLFAGCTVAYDSAQKRSYKAETGSAPGIMETDSAALAPLLEWKPVTAALPITAGRVTRIVVIRNLRRGAAARRHRRHLLGDDPADAVQCRRPAPPALCLEAGEGRGHP